MDVSVALGSEILTVVELNANDGVELQVFQSSGTSLTLGTGNGAQLALVMIKATLEPQCPTLAPTLAPTTLAPAPPIPPPTFMPVVAAPNGG